MKKFICIHGHFYQPPRENPWLEEVETQDTAYPYHDWNQRITAECYAPNSTARILDGKGMITDMINNYANISFNFGPTLLSWMKRNDSTIYEAIIRSDEMSMKKFSGHGSAMAQCYNHIIMPLANSRDKRTQIVWGIEDFKSHFHRDPEGMWFPETAVDLESMEIMAELGIKYILLAPHQAKCIRPIHSKDWQDTNQETMNTRMPYICKLPSGKTISVFFYDGRTSQDVAFKGLLDDGINFANRLMGLFGDEETAQIVHIATDGETYGHHHTMGDMALASCLNCIDKQTDVKITNYAEFLEQFPPRYEVEIIENSSWSCVHGVERWREDCGCYSGQTPEWKQLWRKPLRDAMDWLRDQLIEAFDKQGSQYFIDIWKAREEYISIVLERSQKNIEQFFKRNQKRALPQEEKVKALKLLESQRHVMLMYTSCGWFFDEITGIETIQILQYAARAIQLSEHLLPHAIEKRFIDMLEKAPSNLSKYGNGAYVYLKLISPYILNFSRVAAHYAISSLFENYTGKTLMYSYNAQNEFAEVSENDKQKLIIGKVIINASVTLESETISYAVFHLGGHNLTAGVMPFDNEKEFQKMNQEIKGSFKEGDTLATIRLIEKYFGAGRYSLRHLFKDEQSKILYQILDETLEKINASLEQINEYHYPIMQVVKALQIPLPKVLSDTVHVMLNTDLIQVLGSQRIDFYRLGRLVEEIKEWELDIDRIAIEFIVRKRIDKNMNDLIQDINDVHLLEDSISLLKAIAPLHLNINLWKAQNIFFVLGKKYYREMTFRSDKEKNQWNAAFDELGKILHVKAP